MDTSTNSEHAVIIHFNYGIDELDSLYDLESKLERCPLDSKVGKYDGHEIALDNTDGFLYMYGPNAETLFKAIQSTLDSTEFMKGAKALLRFGPPQDGVHEIEVEIE